MLKNLLPPSDRGPYSWLRLVAFALLAFVVARSVGPLAGIGFFIGCLAWCWACDCCLILVIGWPSYYRHAMWDDD